MNKKLSVVISTYNGEKKIEDCLKSVKDLTDEIIIINNSSTDNTEKISKKYTPHVFTRPNNPMLNINKNFGFSKASREWILNLDDDERISLELAEEITHMIGQDNNEVSGYWIPRKNIIFGKWIEYTGWYPDYQLRLFRRRNGAFAEEHVHEMITVKGKTSHLKQNIIHYNYELISQFIQKLNTIYTPNECDQLLKSGYEFHWADSIKRPTTEFINRFFAQKGYKDGFHGLALSLLMAFYHLIVVLRVWEKQGFKEVNNKKFIDSVRVEFENSAQEVKYWMLTSQIERASNKVKKMLYKMQRKLISRKFK